MIRVASESVELAVEPFGNGPPLIFAHGLSANRDHSRRELLPLSSRYRVLVFDQRGHGDSTPIVDPLLYDPAAMARDIGAILDHQGIDRAVVGGESMGAATAMLFARQNPDRVAALLLVAPAFGSTPNPDRQRLSDLGEEIDREGFDRFLANSAERLRTRFGAPPEVVSYIGRMHRAHRGDSLATAFRTVANWIIPEDLSSLARRDTPIGVVAWNDDATHSMELARRLAAAAPRARLTVLPSALELFSDSSVVGQALEEQLERFGHFGP